ncbi:MATE family efflux transporter [Odoribacter sp. Z80]|uniref:MATE family efflux transporter n=1 Tax=Odoribacter sp. Z80 TaxID=2304575 RepID=UPI00137A1604|nr:MATE family efflux transporter [Odoribacter sp. Z80]NCE72575.1 MATE family efflux transporter [Odoribacter sp. Z80]
MTEKTPLALGTEDIRKLLMRYAIPAIIAMTAASLYNMMDSIFIGHGVGPLAIAGLAITFPFINLAAAFGSLVGVGASTLVSVKMGQKDLKSAEAVLGNVLLLNITIGLLFMAVCLIFLEPILYFFGASEDTLPYARDYMKVILYGNLITHIYMGLNEVMRASGYPQRAMAATLFAVAINGVLNALFIFVFDMGIRGAALGTICAQFLALLGVLVHFISRKSYIRFQRGIFHVKWHIVWSMLAIGLSPFLMNICSCLVVMLVNNGLKTHGGDMYIGAYGIINRVVFLFIMIVMGFNQGMQPIAGYNFGARQSGRVIQILKYTILCGTTVTTLGFLICQIFPRTIIRFFTTDEGLIGLAEHGMRLILLMLPVIGFQMVSTSFFQSIGMAGKAIFLSLTRQLIFLVPCLFILPHYWGPDGVWGSFPVADALSTITTGLMLGWQMKKFKRGAIGEELL